MSIRLCSSIIIFLLVYIDASSPTIASDVHRIPISYKLFNGCATHIMQFYITAIIAGLCYYTDNVPIYTLPRPDSRYYYNQLLHQ